MPSRLARLVVRVNIQSEKGSRTARKIKSVQEFGLPNQTGNCAKPIGKVNAKFDKPKVIFVETLITEENCYATKNSLLWQTDEDNLPADQL
ncbi:MAG: hypothetical protein ACR2MG_07120 [Pyrinomonadaceae bacterium]